MSLLYRVMYALGYAPWDRGIPEELRRLVEGEDRLPAGRALDLGSGMGRKAVYLAEHGWRVTGVEMVGRALREGRRRAAAAGVDVDFRAGDVTRLDALNLEPGFDLFFDFGCYHGLREPQRVAYAAGVEALAAPAATLLMMAFTKAIPPIPSGVSGEELEGRFPGWDLVWSQLESGQEGTPAMRRASAGWFRLRRRG